MRGGKKTSRRRRVHEPFPQPFYTTRRRQAAITYGEAVPLFYCGGAAATTLGAKGAVKPKNPTAVGRSNLRTLRTLGPTGSVNLFFHNPSAQPAASAAPLPSLFTFYLVKIVK